MKLGRRRVEQPLAGWRRRCSAPRRPGRESSPTAFSLRSTPHSVCKSSVGRLVVNSTEYGTDGYIRQATTKYCAKNTGSAKERDTRGQALSSTRSAARRPETWAATNAWARQEGFRAVSYRQIWGARRYPHTESPNKTTQYDKRRMAVKQARYGAGVAEAHSAAEDRCTVHSLRVGAWSGKTIPARETRCGTAEGSVKSRAVLTLTHTHTDCSVCCTEYEEQPCFVHP